MAREGHFDKREGRRVAVVTGGNRGIGLALVRELAVEEEGIVVVLAARNPASGAQACEELNLPNVLFQQLDVQDPSSIACFAAWLQAHLGGLDILINNAGVLGALLDQEALVKDNIKPEQMFIDDDARKKVFINDYETGKTCIDINYYGSKRLIEALLPLFKPSSTGAHIINVSSSFGQLRRLPNEPLRQQMNDVGSLTQDFVDKTLECYLEDLKEGKLEEGKWPTDISAYKMSKIALNAYTRMLAKEFSSRPDGQKLYVNAVNTGYVKTDINWNTGVIPPHEAAHDIVWVALHSGSPPPSGQFFFQKELLPFF